MQHAQQVEQLDAARLGPGLGVDQHPGRPAALGTALCHQLHPVRVIPLQHESSIQLHCPGQDQHAQCHVGNGAATLSRTRLRVELPIGDMVRRLVTKRGGQGGE